MKWDRRFLKLADEVASWSRDPSTKVGAVITRPDRTIASLGYNGFPRSLPDDDWAYNERAIKHKYVVHAEANAIVTAREPLNGYTLYTTLPACNECMKLIVQAGIKRVVSYAASDAQRSRMYASLEASERMADFAGIERVTLPFQSVSASASERCLSCGGYCGHC